MSLEVLKKNEQLLRRARLRRALATHSGKDGFPRAGDIAEHLGEAERTVNMDLKALGAVKVRDTIDGTQYEWWMIPAWNPLLPDMREVADEKAILNELNLKIKAHVLEMYVHREDLVVITERSAGPLMADWFSLLAWPEIVHVIEGRNSVIVRCLDGASADDVMHYLIGGPDAD